MIPRFVVIICVIYQKYNLHNPDFFVGSYNWSSVIPTKPSTHQENIFYK